MGQESHLISSVGVEVSWRLGLTVQTRLPEVPAGEELQAGQFLLEETEEPQALQVSHLRTSGTPRMKTALLIPEKKCSRNSPTDHLACPLRPEHPEAQPLLLPFLRAVGRTGPLWPGPKGWRSPQPESGDICNHGS